MTLMLLLQEAKSAQKDLEGNYTSAKSKAEDAAEDAEHEGKGILGEIKDRAVGAVDSLKGKK